MNLLEYLKELARICLQWSRYRGLIKLTPLKLDFWSNRSALQIWNSILVKDEYALGFPTGQEELTILDVGAHFGFFALYAQKHIDENCKIYAIEPAASNLSVLRKNIAKGQGCPIEIRSTAFSDRSGSQMLGLGKSFNNGFFGRTDKGIVSVDTLTLFDFLEQEKIPEVHFLKIDCEGAEFPIILSADDHVLRQCAVISLEFHERKTLGHDPNKIVAKLKSAGFEIMLYAYARDKKGVKLHFGKIVARRI